MSNNLTLGSLFDGSGGFPLGGLLSGVTPVWASEIEPFPIRVTTRRLPEMKHYGDISAMDGGRIEPVDIICFGSPCTDMSVAGLRAGLGGKQSVLFYEAVRIIKEMRCATNGKYPRWICWENVPGAFSSNSGRDFKAVLEAIIGIAEPETQVPMPEKSGWSYADCYMGDGWSVAYRTLDCQYWGLPQRRKRIFLVGDLNGKCAGKVLFESEGLSRYSAESFRAWQRITSGADQGFGKTSINCLNDQGGQFMSCSENITGTLRSQMHGHPPILLESNQNHATVRTDGVSSTLPASMGMGGGYVPMIYENHGIDARYKGPLDVAPTMSARYGTGGNNVPLVEQPAETFCIVGNIIDRKTENGGNGLDCQKDIAYTLTGMDRHAVYSRQRIDIFKENDVVSTESARQHKDATDLVMQPYQQTVGTIGFTDHKGINNQYVSEDKCVVEGVNLIRRLTPLECERLQGFPDHWTDIPGASDSARYKALGNSVAVPCVDFVMNGIRLAIEAGKAA